MSGAIVLVTANSTGNGQPLIGHPPAVDWHYTVHNSLDVVPSARHCDTRELVFPMAESAESCARSGATQALVFVRGRKDAIF